MPFVGNCYIVERDNDIIVRSDQCNWLCEKQIMAATVHELNGLERERFLRVVQEATSVQSHLQLFSWLQGEFQSFLRHQVLLAFVGDFATESLSYDFVSALPSIRTQNCLACDRLLVSNDLFSFWRSNGRKMLGFDGPVSKLVNPRCDCEVGEAMTQMGASLVHGLHDTRAGDDALYLFCRTEPGFDRAERAMLELLLPQIDFACRRVVALEKKSTFACVAHSDAPLVDGDEASMSARELEVMKWVRAGKTNGEIGKILEISPFTVKNHLQRIFRKMNVLNRAQAVDKLSGRGLDA